MEYEQSEFTTSNEDQQKLYNKLETMKSQSYNICRRHKKEYKLLNYNREEGPIFVCKNCENDLDLSQTFRISGFSDFEQSEFSQVQRNNYNLIQDEFEQMQRKLDRAVQSFNKQFEEVKQKIQSILKDKYLRQIQQDQLIIFNEIQYSINSFQEGKLNKDDFEQDIQYYFQKEKSISNPNDSRYHYVNKFFSKISSNLKKFKNEIQLTFNESIEKLENQNNQIQLSSLQETRIEQNLSLYKKLSLELKEFQKSNLRYFSQVFQNKDSKEKSLVKQIEPLNLSQSNDISMILTKNKYENFCDFLDTIKLVLPYSQKLKLLQIKNHQNISQEDICKFKNVFKKYPLLRLTHLELDFRNTSFQQSFYYYMSKFHTLYPKLQHVNLVLGKIQMDEFSLNITEGLEPIREQLLSFQLQITQLKPHNLEYFQQFLERIIREAKQLKILSLRFQSLYISENDCYKIILDYLIQSLNEHSNLQILEIEIPSFYGGLLDNQIDSFNSILKKQINLKVLRINWSNFQQMKASQANLTISSLEQFQNLKCLELVLNKSNQIDKQIIINLSNVLNRNLQLQELILDCSYSNKFDEESFLMLSSQIEDLVNLINLRLRFNNMLDISDTSLNNLSKSLQNIYTKTNNLKLEQFEINFKSSQQITDSSLINLLQILNQAKNLKKLKLGFFKNRIISSKPLKLLTNSLQNGHFQNLQNIMVEFGSDKFDNQIVKQFINQLIKLDRLAEIRLYFGQSMFDDDLLQDLIQLIISCQFLKKIEFNLFKSNAFTKKFIKELIRQISRLSYLKEVRIDLFYSKFTFLQDIMKLLKKIESKCLPSQFAFKINEESFYQIFSIKNFINSQHEKKQQIIQEPSKQQQE